VTLELDRVYLGDCLELMREMPDGSVDAIVTDPPYSSGGMYRADRTRATSTKYLRVKDNYPDFPGDGRDQRGFYHWCTLWMSLCWQKSKMGALLACFTDWRQLPTVSDALQGGGWIWRGIFVWDKTEAARPQLGQYRAQCEYVVWGSKGVMGDGPAAPGVYRGATVPTARRDHQTEKPVELIETLLTIVPEGGVVLDPFLGSGTTAVACVNTGRRFVGFELHPEYYEIAVDRIQAAQEQTRLFPFSEEAAF